MKTRVTFLVFAFIVLLFAAILGYLFGDKEYSKFFISIIASGGFIFAIKIIPEREKIRLCPLILQGNYGGLHKIRFRNSA